MRLLEGLYRSRSEQAEVAFEGSTVLLLPCLMVIPEARHCEIMGLTRS